MKILVSLILIYPIWNLVGASQGVPSTLPLFVVYLNESCDHCKNVIDHIINEYSNIWPAAKFHTIKSKKQYVTIIYFEANTNEAITVYIKEVNYSALSKWIDNIRQTEIIKGPVYDSKRMLEESTLCANYEKISKETISAKQKLIELKDSIRQLKDTLNETNKKVSSLGQTYNTNSSTIIEAIKPFLLGILIGSLLWNIKYYKAKY